MPAEPVMLMASAAVPSASGARAARAVLVAGDDQTRVAEVRSWLEQEGFAITTAASGAEAVQTGRKSGFDLVVITGFDDLSAREAARLLRRSGGRTVAALEVSKEMAREDLISLAGQAIRLNELETALSSSVARFQAVMRGSSQPMALITPDGTYRDWNPQWSLRVSGESWHEGRSLFDDTAEEDRSPLSAAIVEAVATGERVSLHRGARRADGSSFPSMTSISALPGLTTPELLVECVDLQSSEGEPSVRTLVMNAPMAACALDGMGRCTAANAVLCDLLGRPERTLLGTPFGDLLEPSERRRWAVARTGGEPVHLNLSISTGRGPLPVIVHASPLGASLGADRYLVFLSEGHRPDVASADHLTRSYALTAAIRRLHNGDVAAVLSDVLRVVMASVKALGAAVVQRTAGTSYSLLASAVAARSPAADWHPGSDPEGVARLERVELPLPGSADEASFLIVCRAEGGRFGPPELRFLTEMAAAIGTAIARERAYHEHIRASTHDPLTDLPNRTYFAEQVAQALQRGRGRPFSVAVLMLDIDRFHSVNDGLSYEAGDELLCLLADRLRSDIPDNDLLARTGGDEFALLVCDAQDQDAIDAVAEQVAALAGQPFDLRGANLQMSLSIGVAVGPLGQEEAEDLLKQAHLAMGRAKRAGGARCVTFDKDMDHLARAHLELVGDMRRGTTRGEFVPWYQPVVDMVTGAVTGVEALVRWEHPTRGLLQPSEFVALAEETGTITLIGGAVLEQACLQVAAWRKTLPGASRLTLAVNVSTRQLANAEFVDRVGSALAAAALDSHCVTLEITESALLEEPGTSLRVLDQLAELGLSISIDDFGTGYSSLSYLKQFPVHELKVDRRFIAGLGSGGAPEIAAAVIGLAQSLELRVVAEGVETEEQLHALRSLGAVLGQGYLWSPPMSVRDFENWWAGAGRDLVHAPEGAHVEVRPAGHRRPEVDAVVLQTVRRLLRIEDTHQAVGILSQLVESLGGYAVPSRLAHGNGLPFDLSLGEVEPVVPMAEVGSVTELLLCEVLPDLLDDAAVACDNARRIARLSTDAAIDPLTGLLNRRGLSRIFPRLQLGDVIALIDLDQFKEVNDSFGHQKGDEVLRMFGRMLRQEGRAADHVARLGGDEFMVIFLRSPIERLAEAVERLRVAWPRYRPLPLTFTAGAAAVTDSGGAERALRQADAALYRAKAAGRDRFDVYSEDDEGDPHQDDDMAELGVAAIFDPEG